MRKKATLFVFIHVLLLLCWPYPSLAISLHGTLVKAGAVHPQAGWAKLHFNHKTKHPTTITLEVLHSVAESDGRGRIQFLPMSIAMANARIPSSKELWRKFLHHKESPDMVFQNVSGQKNQLVGTLSWRGVDRHIRTQYEFRDDRVNFRFPGHLIDWAFEVQPPKGLEIDSVFEIEIEVPVRYVRPSEKR